MILSLPEDRGVRGEVYLCQVSACVSCGSCCGLYNIQDLSRERLYGFLKERTELFTTVPRTIDAILAFEQERIRAEGATYPIAEFHHCVFVGLIQDQGERIGCLLHPLASGNNGIDWRGLSFYGGAACKHFFCPSYDELPSRFKQIVRMALSDWYEYGLIVVEHRLLAALFGLLENTFPRELSPEDLGQHQLEAIALLLRTKLTWPFRNPSVHQAHNFFSTKATARPQEAAPRDAHPLEAAALCELDTAPKNSAEALVFLREQIRHVCSILTA